MDVELDVYPIDEDNAHGFPPYAGMTSQKP
jgi:hypothetical protein